jgi:hypothetical protein
MRLPSHETGFGLANLLHPARYRDNALDLMILKGRVAVLQKVGLVPLSNDAGAGRSGSGRSDVGHRAGLSPIRRYQRSDFVGCD